MLRSKQSLSLVHAGNSPDVGVVVEAQLISDRSPTALTGAIQKLLNGSVRAIIFSPTNLTWPSAHARYCKAKPHQSIEAC